MYKSIIEAVIYHSEQIPEKIAIADAEQSYSYQELALSVYSIARWMESVGFDSGDTVLVECTQDTNFILIDLACELMGIIFVPTEKNALKERIKTIYHETKAKCIIGKTDYSNVGRFYNILSIAELQKNSVIRGDFNIKQSSVTAEVLFTTGTTGQPKGIVISNSANIAIAENICKGVQMKKDTVEIIPLPISHSHGLRTCYANLLNGSTVVIADGIVNIGRFFSLIEEYNVNAIDISPTLAKLLLKIARTGLVKYADRIDYIEIGTAVLDNDVKEQLKAIFSKARLYNFYGSTEAGRCCVLDFNSFDRPGCIGYPACNASLFVVDDQRNVISDADSVGLIAVSGKMMMDGYLGDDELTNRTLKEGVLYTNDLGYIDEEGRVYVMGRADDIINYKGIKIAPEEIEMIAMQFDGLVDCACVPVDDKICGQVPKLFISIRQDFPFDKKEFIGYLKKNLDSSRVPQYVEVISYIPRSSNGKLQRKRLKNEK